MNIWLAHWGIDSPSLDCTMWQFGAVEIEDEEYDGNVYYSDYSVKKDDNTGETIRSDDITANNINVFYQTNFHLEDGFLLLKTMKIMPESVVRILPDLQSPLILAT
mgnify:CR=1 FL=1